MVIHHSHGLHKSIANNLQSIRVMEKLGMHHDPADDFDNPNFTNGHKMQKHVLYRIKKEEFLLSENASSLK